MHYNSALFGGRCFGPTPITLTMFTLSSRARKLEHNNLELRIELQTWKVRFNELQERWNKLVRRINNKGGEEFLEKGRIGVPQQFSPDDLRRLLQLCHPDKHNGSALAVEMTAKLNKARS